MSPSPRLNSSFFFFNDTATTEIYTLSLHDALPICGRKVQVIAGPCSVENKQQLLETAHAVKEMGASGLRGGAFKPRTDRKSTRLNSSHLVISYAVFCLKKKTTNHFKKVQR